MQFLHIWRSKELRKTGFFHASRKLSLAVCRFGAFFFYFAVYLGQLNMLAHWKAEQTSFAMIHMVGFLPNVLSPEEWINDSFSYWSEDDNVISSVPFRMLYRSKYTTTPPTPPSYTMYTLALTWQLHSSSSGNFLPFINDMLVIWMK